MKFLALPRTATMELMRCLRTLMDDDDDMAEAVVFQVTPLEHAICDGDESKVKELLEQESDTGMQCFGGDESCLLMALTHQRFKILVLLLQASHRNTYKIRQTRRELESAIDTDCNIQYLRLLLCYCTDTNLRNWLKLYLMFHAIKRQNIDTIKDLLLLGVDVNANFGLECFLHVAIRCGIPAIVQLLIENKADINRLDHLHETPLFVAVRTNSLDVVTLLVQLGASVNAQNLDRQTPLHIAATSVHNSIELVRVLLRNGALFNIKDRSGNTPLALSLRNFMLHPTFQITKCLIQHGNLPREPCEMEALEWAVIHTRDNLLLKYVDRAGIQKCLNAQIAAERKLLMSFRALLILSNNDGKCIRLACYQHQMAPTLYVASLVAIRTHLINIADGESIYNRIQALPLPEVIRQNLLLED